jgi:hypothetical protein
MVFTPVGEADPSRKMAVTGAAIELAEMHKAQNGHGIVSEPYHVGRAGKLLRAAKTYTAAGAGLDGAGVAHPAGGRCVRNASRGRTPADRFRVFYAGMASAKDPQYAVVPQPKRMAARENDCSSTLTGDPAALRPARRSHRSGRTRVANGANRLLQGGHGPPGLAAAGGPDALRTTGSRRLGDLCRRGRACLVVAPALPRGDRKSESRDGRLSGHHPCGPGAATAWASLLHNRGSLDTRA